MPAPLEDVRQLVADASRDAGLGPGAVVPLGPYAWQPVLAAVIETFTTLDARWGPRNSGSGST